MKKILLLFITLLVFVLLYQKVNYLTIIDCIRQTNPWIFTIALLLFIPQFVVIAIRWKFFVSLFQEVSFVESLKVTLGSQPMNLFLPSKTGDFAKIAIIDKEYATVSQGIGLVVIEKLLDVAALACVMIVGQIAYLLLVHGNITSYISIPIYSFLCVLVIGLVIIGLTLALLAIHVNSKLKMPNTWFSKMGKLPLAGKLVKSLYNGISVISLMRSKPYFRLKAISYTFCLWGLHLLQIYLFFYSLKEANNIMPSILQFSVFVPLAIFVGLIPITIAGFGTRDASLLLFFPELPQQGILAIALFINLRYIVPALVGLPFVSTILKRLTKSSPKKQS